MSVNPAAAPQETGGQYCQTSSWEEGEEKSWKPGGVVSCHGYKLEVGLSHKQMLSYYKLL